MLLHCLQFADSAMTAMSSELPVFSSITACRLTLYTLYIYRPTTVYITV